MGSNDDPFSDFLAQFPLPFSSSSSKREQVKLATGQMIVPDVQRKILDLEKILSEQSPLPRKPYNQNLFPGKPMGDVRQNLSEIAKNRFQGPKEFDQRRTFAKNDSNFEISGRSRLSKFANTGSLNPRDLDRLRKDLSQDYTDTMRQQLSRATNRPFQVPKHRSQQVANFPIEETLKINSFSNYNDSSRPHLQNITTSPFQMSNEYEQNRRQNYQMQPQMMLDRQIGVNKVLTQTYGDYGHQQMLKGTKNPRFSKELHQDEYSVKSQDYMDYGHQRLSNITINPSQVPKGLVQDDYSVQSQICIDYGHQHLSKVASNSQFSKELDQEIALSKYDTRDHHRRFEDTKRNYFQGPEELEQQKYQSKKIKLQAHQQLTQEQLLPAEELSRFQSSSLTLHQKCTSENEPSETARRKYTWTKDLADKNNASNGTVHQQSTKITNNLVVVQNVQVMSDLQPSTKVSEIEKKPPEVDSEIKQPKLDAMVKQEKSTGKNRNASDTAAKSKEPKKENSGKYIEVAIMKNNFPNGKFADKEIKVLRKRITEGILSLLDNFSGQALPKIENFKYSSGVLIVNCHDNGTTVDWIKSEFNDNPNVLPDCTLKVILTSEIKVALEQQTKSETSQNITGTATASIEPPQVNTSEEQSETAATSNDFPAEENIEPEILVLCILTQ